MAIQTKQQNPLTVLGCRFRGGQGKAGVEDGPVHLVQAGLIEDLNRLGYNINFDGHISFDDITEEINESKDPKIGRMRRPRLVSKACEKVYNIVEDHAKAGNIVLTLGGDHSLGMATIGGTIEAHPDLCVLWIDAHADINTPETTVQGWLHGMPVSFLLGLSKMEEYSWAKGRLDPSRIAYIGLRDIEDGEKETLKQHGITAFSMHHVDMYGIGKVVEMALSAINPEGDRPIHLSFDIDALDPTFAPSTGTAVEGGLSFREGRYICEAVAKTGKLVGMDLVEVNPSLTDPVSAKKTVDVACKLIRSAFGENLL
ncbi:hypothetical protein PLEOSDRAFT_1067181 [Pleurotus ostreatus PC15]|uniref:Arginase n=2 Tax=Pleurotus TaxID=5320 RepID=A0A067NJR8_PLEO1|nr:hypothetical protein CCMSSC00406_0002323 [Pleurotus cornucopiae]KDQ24317.1 hypothetical protein PLEOSDRAFT_1067181 [Pleurotus ostreatus PC15]